MNIIKKLNHPVVRRLLIITIFSTLTILAFNEAAFLLVNKEQDRAPKIIELTIPIGTSVKVERGEEVLSIPSQMIFIVGDVLIVKNNDSVGHELGPIFVPPGSSASMKLDEAATFAMACSFRPSKYLGITIKEPTNLFTRLQGLIFTVPSTVVVIFLYSLAARPIKIDEIEQGEVFDLPKE